MSDALQIACLDGRRFACVPAQTALLVIDMQSDFLDPLGYCAQSGDDIFLLSAIQPRVHALTMAARAAGLTVIHTREGYRADGTDIHPQKAERMSVGDRGPLGRFLIRGEAGQDFFEGFHPAPGEAVFDKPGFSAFYRTALEAHLRDRGIARLILTGVTTQCCVHSTLRSAVDRGFWCLTIADACAALSAEVHAAALSLIAAEDNLFGWVAETTAALAAFEEATP